ncbi:hypothetical protein ABAC460_07900 [Asticcacaulis sp. AC460]|uniref:cellulase family glycosylhydrolase n=1 Tax=Asticcacaulis sp. AC460 TaxID=1282360 RepID=UPI0003C3B11F|nr:cellulase family glycosylhydrolase [Asticcacaulis sp. AC460]ESQ90744.1 hypothetical protein ABAC460_07900 [Asticcacaulis sp. AC460]
MRLISLVAIGLLLCPTLAQARPQWTPAQANTWYASEPWRAGANYIPRDAINQLEMWQADTFNPQMIDQELGWAESAGMTTMRVYLHDMLWAADPDGFKQRIETYLAIADRHHIKTIFVLFDSCWDPHPKLGKQPAPKPGLHNSGWLQSPGIDRLKDPAVYPQFEAYVKGVVGAFANDKRILAWDVWNEPHEDGGADTMHHAGAGALVTNLLPKVFDWARSADPTQPLTSGVYDGGDWAPGGLTKLNAIQQTQLTQSDIISFHSYSWPEEVENRITQLKAYGRPVFCTEYLARSAGSTLDGVLPVGHREKVVMVNWGLVDGKTQTRFPWDSYAHPYTDREPVVWFHDLFRADGTPYRQREIDLLRALTDATSGN